MKPPRQLKPAREAVCDSAPFPGARHPCKSDYSAPARILPRMDTRIASLKSQTVVFFITREIGPDYPEDVDALAERKLRPDAFPNLVFPPLVRSRCFFGFKPDIASRSR